ncbi:hypothetical protein PRIPAC_75213 [Pristionchus pacificus]|uniref:Ribosomal protein n=1 Tax=Pristionchus pacificus TaxID=54126 RepID=A0A2A6C6D4_PRIPA|nr:hypothetical protein PRIPAC_75213 [Pristionchus pacificus]|eukprot:PDM73690.1 ribosomal protein [Pristionchus pacificus]
MYPPNSNNVTAPNFELVFLAVYFNWRPEEEKAQSRAEGQGYPEQSQALAGRPLSVDRDEVIKRIAHFLKQTEKPNSYAKASGSVIRKALKSLETLKWSDKSEDGNGRVHSKQGRKDLDRIAAGLRSIGQFQIFNKPLKHENQATATLPRLKSLETLKWSDKSEDGNGRVHSKQGRKDLDRIAAGLRSIDSLASSVRFALCAELRARINNFCHIAKKHTSSD